MYKYMYVYIDIYSKMKSNFILGEWIHFTFYMVKKAYKTFCMYITAWSIYVNYSFITLMYKIKESQRMCADKFQIFLACQPRKSSIFCTPFMHIHDFYTLLSIMPIVKIAKSENPKLICWMCWMFDIAVYVPLKDILTWSTFSELIFCEGKKSRESFQFCL